MLVIRNEQLEAITEHLRKRNPGMVLAYLREKIPARVVDQDDPTLLARIKEILAQAEERWGVRVAWDQCRYALLEVLFGPDFDRQHAWAADLLDQPALPITKRMDALDFYYVNYLAERPAAAEDDA